MVMIKEIKLEDIKCLFRKRDLNSNKGDFGKVGILGGSIKYSGAVKLANMSLCTLRSGCGLVRVIVPKEIISSVSPYLLGQTLYPYENLNDIKAVIKDLGALAIGMGWDYEKEHLSILEYVLENFRGKLILDADGLNTLGGHLELLRKSNAKIVLTPHLKEFSRLTGLSILSILGGLYIVAMYNEINDIHDANFIRSTWLFWLFLPLPILSTIISYIYQNQGINCSKNKIISLISCICLLIFGSFFLLPTSFDDQVNHYSMLEDYQSIMDVRIPSSGQLKTGSLESFNYKNISDLEIITVNYEHNDTTILTEDIMNNDNWIVSTEISSELEKLIPSAFSPDKDSYYLFYNRTLNEYNVIPNTAGNYQICTIKYNISNKNLIIYTFYYQL